MNYTEIYFKLKVLAICFLAICILAVVLLMIKEAVMNSIKAKLLKKNGFKYVEGLPGRYVSSDFQASYEKDNIKIMAKEAYNKSYFSLKRWIKRTKKLRQN